ncbi:NUDIX domain-containing protein [Salipiger sp. IMCC34102]|uniref:NUDIX domain-containing protein n=1 Tax=Salipiger sp. IMCC34102 TaxID=2510647 RepID=UPI00101B5DFB|nr:NUDIX hydrolase [Salipiger sp. IMCC34102]RYH01526.1 NUDIX domain-containing protein [Salipiger sp. IMCC34102]
MTTTQFDGAKVALFLGERLLILLRDDDPRIPWPNHWDFPGGGREGAETPYQTVVRETWEEVGLTLTADQVIWQVQDGDLDRRVWFFVARLPASAEAGIVLGCEGQAWRLASVDEVLSMTDVAGNLQSRLARWRAGEAACDVPTAMP